MEHSTAAPAAHTHTVALVGNPNVGKSTLFNALTGLDQHTGNWPGKTVSLAAGDFTYNENHFTLIDLPGTYSLSPASAEEEVTRDYLLSGAADAVLIVADATCLKRNLLLTLDILDTAPLPIVLCVNLLDEAKKKGITIDLPILAQELGIPVIGTAARSGEGLDALKAALADCCEHRNCCSPTGCRTSFHHRAPPSEEKEFTSAEDDAIFAYMARAEDICTRCVFFDEHRAQERDRRLDRLFTSRRTGIPMMLLLFGSILYLTIVGANIPSELLSNFLFSFEPLLQELFAPLGAFLSSALVDGVYRTVAWVVSVMLPPMAIFFPLFTLLEDAGYLPRFAFNLDRCFACVGAHGRQSLTMCMGLGCNACGVIGCRIIDSPEERLIAMLTNAFIPCNGRFPLLIALLSLFFAEEGLRGSITAALLLLGLIVLAVCMTLAASRLLSSTVLCAPPSAFSLELPPYRRPKLGEAIIHSLLDRTLFVLGRAVTVAAPAGLIIYLAANLHIGSGSLLAHAAGFLDPFGRFLGMDGMILLAFLLGFPANEIVLPVLLMGYSAGTSLVDYASLTEVKALLLTNGWSDSTALCVMLFSLFHFPCGTTCLTLRKESGSLGWTTLGILLPTVFGVGLCALIDAVSLLLFY